MEKIQKISFFEFFNDYAIDEDPTDKHESEHDWMNLYTLED